jgi:hypothetical protein
MKRIAAVAAAASLTAFAASAQVATLGEADLARIDANGDGSVTREEFDAFAARAFQMLDSNRDRSLSAAEMEGDLSADAIAELDADGDGAVSRQEFGRQMYSDFAEADKDGDGILN